MAYELSKKPAEGVPTPDSRHVIYFVDENGVPQFKDSSGTAVPAVTQDGGPVTLIEQSAPPAAITNAGQLFAQEIGGVTEFLYKTDKADDREIQISADGALNLTSTPTWFSGGQSADISVAVPGATIQSYNTGLMFPLLGNDQITTLEVRLSAVADTDASDSGFVGSFFVWGTVPTPPFSLIGFLSDSYDDGGIDVFPVSNLTVNVAGELSIEFSPPIGEPYEGSVHVSLSPGRLLTFDPTFLLP